MRSHQIIGTKRKVANPKTTISTADGTPFYASLNQSQQRPPRRMTSIMNNTIRQRKNSRILPLFATSQTTSLMAKEPNNLVFTMPVKTQEDVQVQERLAQMMQDKLHHILIKNRIRRRFFQKRKNEAPDKFTSLDQLMYTTCQNKSMPSKTKYSYFDMANTFFSRTRRRVLQETFHTSAKSFQTQIGPKSKAVPSFLDYTSNRKYRQQFRESRRRCKTDGPLSIQHNKEQILKIQNQKSQQYKWLQEYLEEALHQN